MYNFTYFFFSFWYCNSLDYRLNSEQTGKKYLYQFTRKVDDTTTITDQWNNRYLCFIAIFPIFFGLWMTINHVFLYSIFIAPRSIIKAQQNNVKLTQVFGISKCLIERIFHFYEPETSRNNYIINSKFAMYQRSIVDHHIYEIAKIVPKYFIVRSESYFLIQ